MKLNYIHTDTIKKQKQSCTSLVQILPLSLMPIGEFCANLTDNSTTFCYICILELGTLHGNQHFLLVPGYILVFRLSLSVLAPVADSWMICSPS